MPEQDPQPEAVCDLLLVIGVVTFVIGLGNLAIGLVDAGAASSPRAGITMAPAQESGSAPAHSQPSRSRPNSDRDTPPVPKAWRQNAMNSEDFGSARTYLLEMSARMRRTTLGSGNVTRDAVALDIYAYQWLGLTSSAQEQPGE